MNNSAYFIILSLLYILFLNIIVLVKSHIDIVKFNIFKKMLKLNAIGLILELSCIYRGMLYGANDNYNLLFNKMYLCYLISFCFIFYLYILSIAIGDKKYKQYSKKIKTILTISILTCFTIIFKTSININTINYFSYGLSVNFVYFISFIIIVLAILTLIKYRKSFNLINYLPLIILIVGLTMVAIIQKIIPSLTLITTIESFVLFVMYFTIENPDMKLLEELAVNKNLLQHSNEEKSNLLFKLTQDVKLPVENICNTSKDMLNMKKVIDLKNNSKLINDDANRVRFIINNVLNINDIDYNKIKVFNDTYDINNLYKELILMIKNKINKEVKLNTKIDKDIPILYGDNIKLKQILYSILSNSIKYTKQGNIEFNINHFIQYDVCRLIININDTGCGIDIDKINKVLNDEETDIKSNEIELDLNSVKKLINILGGSIFIDSNKLGTKVSIVLDQRIYETEETKHNKELNNYIKYIGTEKNVLLIDDNYEELNKYAKEIKKYNINVDKSMYGKDILNKIRNNIKYDLIIIDDEMNPYNAVTIMEELNKEENFKTKVIIMIGINKEFIKEHYIKDYKFKDYIIKRNYKTEIERIINKYL